MSTAETGFRDFLALVVRGSVDEVSRCLNATPAFATAACQNGATRQASSEFFLSDIRHYLYRGDTALHMAAAACRRPMAELLVGRGANCGARNRRSAEPLHYAADGNRADPAAQAETITYLVAAGARPNAADTSGVAPLHRAVRTRSLAAVQVLYSRAARGLPIAMATRQPSTKPPRATGFDSC